MIKITLQRWQAEDVQVLAPPLEVVPKTQFAANDLVLLTA